MRSFLLASFALLTLVVVGCDTPEAPKPPADAKPAEVKPAETPKDKGAMEPTTPTDKGAMEPSAPKDKMEPAPAPTTPAPEKPIDKPADPK